MSAVPVPAVLGPTARRRSSALIAAIALTVLIVVLELEAPTARLIVGTVLFGAGVTKLVELGSFARILRRFPVARVLVRSVAGARLLGVAVATAEIILGCAFVLGYRRTVVGALIAIQLLVFSIALVIVLFRRERVPCGCFGRRLAEPVRWTTVARNVGLVAMVALGVTADRFSLDAVLRGAAEESSLVGFYAIAAAVAAATVAAMTRSRANVVFGDRAKRQAPLRYRLAGLVRLLRSGHPRRVPRRWTGLAPPQWSDRTSELQPAFEALAAHERRATALVLDLDRAANGMEPLDENGSLPREARQESGASREEAELLQVDRTLNEGLAVLYVRAAETAGADKILVRTALFHWMVLLRRRSLGGLHTVVEGLVDDPECAGDVIGDQLFAQYFDALFPQDDDHGTEVAAVRALAGLARQSACLGAQQSALLASDLYWSFMELRSFLRANGVERIVPAVAAAASSPLLLFYDVEKWRGIHSPLARWFIEEREALAQAVETRRHPAVWHGLWLYDRRSGHLLGYRVSGDPEDENEVDLGTLLASIVVRENLGNGDCSFAEMVERGLGRSGYRCIGSICAEADNADDQSRRTWRAGSSMFSRIGFALRQTGLARDVIVSTGCAEGSGLGDGRGGGGRACGDGLQAAGRNRLAGTVRCIAEQSIGPTERMFRCMAEAMGMCSNPVDRFAKELQQTAFAGIKVGTDCGLVQPAGAGGGETRPTVSIDTQTGTVTVEAGEGATDEDVLTALQDASNQLQNQAMDALRRLEEAEAAYEDAQEDYEEESIDIEQLIDAYELDAARDALNNAREEFNRLREGMRLVDEAIQEQKDKMREKAGRSCPADVPDCGTNDCTAMSEWARQTLACTMQYLEPGEQVVPFGPIDPGVVDPSPLDDSTSSSWTNCLSTINEEAPQAGKGCWAYDCLPFAATIAVADGRCGCGRLEAAGEGAGMRGNCGAVDCGEGLPVFQDGRCTCPPQGGGGGLEPSPPRAPSFSLETPLPFTQAWLSRGDVLISPTAPTSGIPATIEFGSSGAAGPDMT